MDTIKIIFAVYGILIGSFLNVCILRIPKKESITFDRSHCTKCNYQLRWFDLVPILSYLILGGKCRKCKSRISIQYPIIELLNGAAYLGIYYLLGVSLSTVIACLTFSVMLVIFVIDYRHKIIPNSTVVFVAVLGIVQTIMDKEVLNHLIGMISVSGFLILLVVLTRKPLGLGDIKLMAAAGLLLGWQEIVLALMLGSTIGSITGISLIVLKINKWKQKIAFGPFLTIGIMISMLFGESIIAWYLEKII